MSYESFLTDHFPDLKIRGYQATARCLFHEDKRQSFSINIQTGLWMCFAGCGHGNIITLARRLGSSPPASKGLTHSSPRINPPLTAASSPAARFDGGAPPKVIAEYIYQDEAGQPLFKVCRTEPKSFFQKKYLNGSWQGGSMEGVRRVPYHLPQILAHDKNKWLFLVEGEKDAEKLTSLDLVATTTAMGAASWNADYAPHFAGRKVVVLPDNDTAGQSYGERAANDIVNAGGEVKLVRLPGLADKGDVSDYLGLAGNSRETLLDLVRNAPQYRAMHRPHQSPFEYFAERNIVIQPAEDVLPGEFKSLCKSAYLAISSSFKGPDFRFDLIDEAEAIWMQCDSAKQYESFLSKMMEAHAA